MRKYDRTTWILCKKKSLFSEIQVVFGTLDLEISDIDRVKKIVDAALATKKAFAEFKGDHGVDEED